ncbi:MAG: RidA family protein [Nevskiaceae bacterium]|nr:MAG: RidA family protein [Nevskiaceae bacterium]TBR72018.1 MAG: RidA family protein [Nevskiaceae bacterium]
MGRKIIKTDRAPAAIGSYSQAVACGDTVYLSGQIGLDPATGSLVAGGAETEIRRVFENLAAVAEAAGGSLRDAVKVTVYLTDLANYKALNALMSEYFPAPCPARAAVQVAALPRGAVVEADAVLVLG